MKIEFGPFRFETRASSGGAKSGIQNPSQWLLDWLGASKSATGIDVQETSAMQATAVYACVTVLAETLGTIPLPVYQRGERGGKFRAPKHPLYRLLHDYPNPEMTSADFRRTMMTHQLLWGNAYAEIQRDASGRPIALWPLRPDRMQIWRSYDEPYTLEYWYSLYSGGFAILKPEQVLHIKNLSIDGIRGLSPVAHQREAIGLSLALEKYAASFFGNDASPSGFLSHPGQLSEKARENIRKGWEAGHMGLTNAHRMAVFEEGISFQKVGMPPDEAQFIQSRQYQLTEIARMYRVPLHLLGELGRVTHANIEHMGIDFVTHTIRPHLVNWEQSIQQKLFLPKEQETFFAEFVVEGLLRGDLASRYNSYAIGRQWGWLSANEIREKENMNPIAAEDGGDDYIIAMNMGPADGSPAFGAPQPPITEASGPPEEISQEDRFGRDEVWLRWYREKLDSILRREKIDVLKHAQKLLLRKNMRDFQQWLVTFYTQDHPAWIQERLLAGPFADEPREFAADYVGEFALRYSQLSLQSVQSVLVRESGESLPALESLFGDWETERMAAVIKREAYRLRLNPRAIEAASTATPSITINQPITIQQPNIENRIVTPPSPVTVEGARIDIPLTVHSAPAPNVTVQAPATPNVTVHTPAITVQGARMEFPVTLEAAPAPNVTVEATNINVDVAAPNISLPAVTVEAAPSPNVTVEATSINVDVAAPAISMAPVTIEAAPSPNVNVEATQINVEVAAPPPATVNVAAPPSPNVTVEGTQINVDVAAPEIPVTVLPATPPNVDFRVDATEITVEAPQINVPVTVQPAATPNVDVTVEATEINVAAPNVEVPVTVHPAPAPQVEIRQEAAQITFPEQMIYAPVQVDVQPAEAPIVTVEATQITVEGPQIEVPVTVQAAPTPNVTVEATEITVEAPNIEIPVNIQPADVFVEGTQITVDAPNIEVPITVSPSPAPDVNVEATQITVEAPNVEVPITVQPAAPAQVEVRIDPPQVHVSSPEITVEAPEITVEQPDVNVTVQPAQVHNTFEAQRPDIINVQPSDVTVLPADVQVNVEQPENTGTEMLYDRHGNLLGTTPRKRRKDNKTDEKPPAKSPGDPKTGPNDQKRGPGRPKKVKPL